MICTDGRQQRIDLLNWFDHLASRAPWRSQERLPGLSKVFVEHTLHFARKQFHTYLILHNSIKLGLFHYLLSYFQPHFLHGVLKKLSRLLNYVMEIVKFDTSHV